MGSSVMQILAENPLRAQAQANQNQLTQAQVPLLGAQAQQEQLKAAQMQQQIQDQAALTEAWKNSFGQPPSDFQSQNTPSSTGSSSSSSQAPSPQQQLLGVTDQKSYDNWRAVNPGVIAPASYSPLWVSSQTKGVTPPQAASGAGGSQSSAPQTAGPQQDRFVEMLRREVVAGRLSAAGYQSALVDHQNFLKNSLQLSKDQADFLQTSSNKAGAALEAFDNLPQENKTPENWGKTFDALVANSPVPLDFSRDQLPTADQIQLNYGKLNYLGQIGKDAQTRADTAKAQADAAEAAQKTATQKRQQAIQDLSGVTDQPSYNQWRQAHPEFLAPSIYSPNWVSAQTRTAVPIEKQPEYQLDQEFLQNSNQQSRHAAVDAIAKDPAVRQSGYGLVDAVQSRADYEKALQSIRESQNAIDFAVNPQVQAGKEKVAAVEGATRAREEIAAQQGQYAGTPMASVPPHLVQAAASDYKKATDEHDQAVQAADDMQTFTNLARAGNKVAYSYSPVEGVLTLNTGRGVKRVNMNEIEGYGGAGSALDRIKGWLGKQTSGASIPADILNDMDQLHSAVRQNADTLYNRKVQSTNYTYGSQFEPQVRPSQSNTATPGGKQAIGGYKIGGTYGNHKYLGGDPKSASSWQ